MPEAVWDAENAAKPNRFGALDATRHIIFRFVSNFVDWRQSYERPLVERVEAAARAGARRGDRRLWL